MTRNTRVTLGFFSFFILATIAIIVWGNRLTSERENNRVVVLAYVYKVNNLQVGLEYECYYFYDHRKYTTVFSYLGSPILEVGTLLFTEISSENPDNSNTLYKMSVPSCFSMDSMPPMGWKEIPTCDTK